MSPICTPARVEAVKLTVSGLLGPRFDEQEFDRAYSTLNRPEYHGFTADNQDYLAYVSLMLGAGPFALDELAEDIATGRLRGFADFAARAGSRRDELIQSGLLEIHEEVWAHVQAGDPTPFKAFRYQEYLCTAARFGQIPGATADQLLVERITITQEVHELVLELRRRGALVFGISDKPDEASLPNTSQAAAGMRPLHLLETASIGQAAATGSASSALPAT